MDELYLMQYYDNGIITKRLFVGMENVIAEYERMKIELKNRSYQHSMEEFIAINPLVKCLIKGELVKGECMMYDNIQ